jgi:hypothetical protein
MVQKRKNKVLRSAAVATEGEQRQLLAGMEIVTVKSF